MCLLLLVLLEFHLYETGFNPLMKSNPNVVGLIWSFNLLSEVSIVPLVA